MSANNYGNVNSVRYLADDQLDNVYGDKDWNVGISGSISQWIENDNPANAWDLYGDPLW